MPKYLPKTGIILLGVIHSDPLGYGRTRTFLSEYKPDLVLVEISPYALSYRSEHARALLRRFHANLRTAARKIRIDYKEALRNSRISAIGRQITLPFEYRASAAYAAGTSARVVPVDWSEFSRKWIRTWAELVSAGNIEALLRVEDSPVPVPSRYEQAARRIRGESNAPDLWTGKGISLWRKRENHIAGEIVSQLARAESEKTVYIGGWRHLVCGDNLKTVRDALGIDLSRCFLLDRGPVLGGM